LRNKTKNKNVGEAQHPLATTSITIISFIKKKVFEEKNEEVGS